MSCSNNPNAIRKTFLDITADMAAHPEGFVQNPGKDFSRNRLLTFQETVLQTINLQTSALDGEMSDFWNVRSKDNTSPLFGHDVPLTKSAFVHARKKFNDRAFPALLNRFNKAFPFSSTCHELHCIAIDGIDENIPSTPDDDAAFISYNSKNGGYYQFHVTTSYHLGDRRYISAVIQPRKQMDEQGACVELMRDTHLPDKCLITNLPADKFPVSELKLLYHLRWGIETSFLFLKDVVSLNHLHSVKRRYLIQEIYAALILYNFISLIVSCVPEVPPSKKYKRRLNFSNAIREGRKFLMSCCFLSGDALLKLLLRNSVPLREGKDRTRNMRSLRLNSLQNRA